MESICIIGAGECGTRAAFALREAGFENKITLVNDETCLPYERPTLSKPDGENQFFREISPSEKFIDNKVDLLTNVHATRINKQEQTIALSNGNTLHYNKLLLTTGSTPRTIPNSDGSVLVMRTKADAEHIYDQAQQATNAVIIGAGLIGLELAAELCGRGIKVTVVEMASCALGRAVPLPTANKIIERHIQAGVSFKFSSKIVEISKGQIILESGIKLPTDLTVAAIGVIPNTALAKAANLICENGISVSNTLQTNDANIFAAGDCANFAHPRYGKIRQETWRNAQEQGQHAALCMLGKAPEYTHIPWFWSDQYDLGLQIAGIPNEEDLAATRNLENESSITFYTSKSGTITAAVGLGIGNSVAKDIRLAEMMIAKNITPSINDLVDSKINLKKLLRS